MAPPNSHRAEERERLEGATGEVIMPRTKALTIPGTHSLGRLMEEHVEMLHEAEKAVKEVLPVGPQNEEFWHQLSEHAAEISMVETRSKTIVGEIDSLINQLPEG
jgi:hypothetical protein